MVSDYQLVIVAGGEGKRLSHITKGLPKCLLDLEGKTLLDRCIELYQIDEVILLLGYGYNKVIEYVENKKNSFPYNSKTIKYSIEEGKLLGKGGAIWNALEKKIINREKPFVLHYPDDLIFEEDFEKKLISQHEENRSNGAWTTMVIVPEVEYQFGMPVLDENGFVRKFEEKPWIRVPTNVGVYVLEPEVNDLILRNEPPFDFESKILKELCEMGKVGSMTIGKENWIPVNDEKSFEKAIRKIRQLT